MRGPFPILSAAAAAAAACALASCSLLYQRTEHEEAADPAAALGQPGALTQGEPAENPLDPSRGVGTNYNVSSEEELMKIDNGVEGEIYWTDPNDPHKDIEGITEAFERRTSNKRWFTHYAKARAASEREGKPLIIWFHDSIASPKSKKLGASLLETPYFEDWAMQNAIRVRLDAGLKKSDGSKPAGTKVYSLDFINGLAAQCGVKHRPAVVVAAPDGYITGRIDGCNPDELNVVDSDIRDYVKQAQKRFEDYKKTLEDKGFRTWKGRKPTSPTLFAKMQKYDSTAGRVYLREFNGKVHRTRYRLLSNEDRAWVDAQSAPGTPKAASSAPFGRGATF